MTPEDRKALTWGAAAVLALTLWRIFGLAWAEVDLFVDEAQYWLWGKEPAFGYFSKPPLVGWAIGLSTGLSGSDAPFWVRLPAPIGYGMAGIILMFAAARLWPARQAAWVGIGFAALPGIALLTVFMSTDALLMPFFALGILALVALRDGRSVPWAVTLGVAIGLGLMSKYAMIYFPVLAGVVVFLVPGWSLSRRDAGVAALVAGLIVLPNLIWNISNGFITFAHTAENAGWQGIRWDWGGVAEFLLIQLAAMGPVIALAFLWLLARAAPVSLPGTRPGLILLSLPIFLAIAGQALIDKANGNWAAPAFLAATALAMPWIAAKGRVWLALALIPNLAVSLILPVLMVFPNAADLGGDNLFRRTFGVADLSVQILEAAKSEDVKTVVSLDRRILSDLTYRAWDTDIAVLAPPPSGLADNHYQLTRPLPEGTAPILFLTGGAPPSACADNARLIFDHDPGTGAFRKGGLSLYRTDTPCW